MSKEEISEFDPRRERFRIERSGSISDTPLDEWVRRAQRGDERAFDALVRLVHPRIHRWAWLRVGDSDEAEEVTQEVLVSMYRHLSEFRGESSVLTWLYRVTGNAAGQVLRKRGRLKRVRERLVEFGAEPASVSPTVEEEMEGAYLRDLVDRFLTRLSDRQRRVFHLVDLEGFTPAEAARMEGLHPNTLRTHLFRARRTIRKRLLLEHPERLPVAYRSEDRSGIRPEGCTKGRGAG